MAKVSTYPTRELAQVLGVDASGNVGLEPASPRPRYLGQVSTRCYLADNTPGAGVNNIRGRTLHVARDAIASLRIIYPNWLVSTASVGDAASPSTATIQAAIEYPIGTLTLVPVTWGGLTSSTAIAGDNHVSDDMPVSIPSGATFGIRYYRNGNSNRIWTVNGPPAMVGDWIESGTGFTTYHAVGASGTQATTVNFYPIALLAQTSQPSVLILGDSIAQGVSDSQDNVTGDGGIISRSVGQALAYINMGRSGDQAQYAATLAAKRIALAQYCSHVVVAHGRNDISTGRTAVQLQADMQTILGLVSDKARFVTTLMPVSTSTDGWITTANQTAAGNNAARLTYNGLVRDGLIVGAQRFFDVANAVESALDSGIWQPSITADGTHPNGRGYRRVVASNLISPASFVR